MLRNKKLSFYLFLCTQALLFSYDYHPFPFAEEIVVNQTTLCQSTTSGIFPVGGNGQSNCTSEAMGMMLSYAVSSLNQELFTGLANGYAFLANQGLDDGLIPWAYNVTSGCQVSIVDKGSALDADIMALGALIQGASVFETLADFLTPLIDKGIEGLVNGDITASGEWTPGNHWGANDTVWNNPMGVFYDYVDFDAVQTIIDYCNQKGKTLEGEKIQKATLSYIAHELNAAQDLATNQGTPDNNASLVRSILYLGNFLSNSDHKGSSFYKDAGDLLNAVMEAAFNAGTITIHYDPNPSWFGNNGVSIFGDRNQFATVGAYLVALQGLENAGFTSLHGETLAHLIQVGQAIMESYIDHEDDGNSVMAQLKTSITNHQFWDNGVYFDMMLFSKSWPFIKNLSSI